jgi:signal transduction histidine kinase
MEYKSRFKSIFQGVVDIVSLIDTNYNIVMVNNAYEKLIERSSYDCIGKKCYYIIRNREIPCEDCPILNVEKADQRGESLIIPVGNENVAISRHPVYDEKGRVVGIFEIGRIITKEIKMEQELQHHGRLKIMGELTASIVHEIKNPLASIGLMAISIMERLKQEKIENDIYQDMGSILKEIQRLEKLLGTLMDFGKPALFLTKSEDIHYPINETLKLLSKKLKHFNIIIKKEFNLGIPKVEIDVSKIQQVFLNILLNAIDAMPEGGEIIIKTDCYQEATEGNKYKNWVQVIIQDSGTGIKKEYMPYIFDPFYSHSKRRTGLGLSIVSRIIDLHKGFIDIQSQEGKGTTVKIYLPTI